MSFIHLEGKRLLWCYLGSATQAAVRHTRLDQRIIGSAQDRLGGLERFDLAGTCLFSHLEVLQQPVTFAMQRLNVLLSGHQGLASGGFLLGMRIEGCLSLCLGFALVCQGLGVNGTLLCGVLHGALVIFLGVFLSCLALATGFASTPAGVTKQLDDRAAGDIGGEGWKRYDDPEEKAFKLNAERNNGRAAMLGITGCLIHELLGVDALYPTGGLGGAAPPSIW